MQGRIQVRTRSQYKAALSADDNSGAKGKSTGGSAHTSGGAADGSNRAAAASEADLRALFDSIDVDGSGVCAEVWRTVLPAHCTDLWLRSRTDFIKARCAAAAQLPRA